MSISGFRNKKKKVGGKGRRFQHKRGYSKIRKNAPVISEGHISRQASLRIKRDGVWVVENLITMKFIYYPGSWCRISRKNNCLYIRRGEGVDAELAAVLMFQEFGINWHYSREALTVLCLKMKFLYFKNLTENVFPENVFPKSPVKIRRRFRKNDDGSLDR